MGATCVFSYTVPEGKSGQQAADYLQKQVEVIGAVKSGNFSIDCESYQSNIQNGPQRTIHILHNSEQPASCFAFLDTGTCLVADILFNAVLSKLKGYYQQRKGAKIESKGQRYELGDFVIKIGSVTMASNFKGILVEVEYCPCVILNDCWNLMKELVQSIMGTSVDAPPQSLKGRVDTEFSPADTINQYLDHFNNFRKAAPVQPPLSR